MDRMTVGIGNSSQEYENEATKPSARAAILVSVTLVGWLSEITLLVTPLVWS